MPSASEIVPTRREHRAIQQRSALLQRVRQLFESFVHRERLAVLTFGVCGFAGSAVLAFLAGLPIPKIHDEFVYLLAGDTFASRRITNPTHPMWQHFESFHIIQQPTYAAKYPPAQGLFLAVGQVLGHPVIGVWISVGLMCAALSWMLYAWLPPKWAVLGALLTTTHIGLTTDWAHSYWGGAVAAAGGALVYGSLRRIVERPRVYHGVLLALGLAILANSRPLEGLLVSLPAAAVLLYRFTRVSREERGRVLSRIFVPVGLLMFATFAGMGYYNIRTTGHIARMPYQVYNDTYGQNQLLSGEEVKSPTYRHPLMERYHREWGLEMNRKMRDPQFVIPAAVPKIITLTLFYAGIWVLAVPMLPRVLRDPWMKLAVVVVVGVTIVVLGTGRGYPHYLAPATGLIVVLLTAALMRLHSVRGPPVPGRAVVYAIVAGSLLFSWSRVTSLIAAEPDPFQQLRPQVIADLYGVPGEDLVLVRYGPNHIFHWEWVYNKADIDAGEIVWAREMNPSADGELLDYFCDRRVWLLEVDREVKLNPHPAAPRSRRCGRM